MKKQIARWFVVAATAALLQGCIGLPSLITVQHKDSNDEVKRRLDSIDHRLERLEDKASEKAEK